MSLLQSELESSFGCMKCEGEGEIERGRKVGREGDRQTRQTDRDRLSNRGRKVEACRIRPEANIK